MARPRIHPKPPVVTLEKHLVQGINSEIGRRNMTIRELAAKTGYSAHHLASALRHDHHGTTTFWNDILDALGLRVTVTRNGTD